MKTLIPAEQISERIQVLASQIIADHLDEKRLYLIGVLKGSFLFLADLARAIGWQSPLDIRIDFIGASSYRDGTSSSGEVQITKPLECDLRRQAVVVVEDIVDSGLTMWQLGTILNAQCPASLRIAALLDKPSRRKFQVYPNYIGFSIPDAFVVGYGLDYQERFRHLPHLAVLEDVDLNRGDAMVSLPQKELLDPDRFSIIL